MSSGLSLLDCFVVEVARSATEDHSSLKEVGFSGLTLVTTSHDLDHSSLKELGFSRLTLVAGCVF